MVVMMALDSRRGGWCECLSWSRCAGDEQWGYTSSLRGTDGCTCL